MTFYKYQGAGNDFLIADNRDGQAVLAADDISALCDRRYGVGADGVMLLEKSSEAAFTMKYYNADGSGGMMCGNGGRCIAAFAVDMGVVDGSGRFDFVAADGLHSAEVLPCGGTSDIPFKGTFPMTYGLTSKTVRLKMKDVSGVERYGAVEGIPFESGGYFLDTGTRHFVLFTESVSGCDVVGKGRAIRYAEEFRPVGTNVNFVSRTGGGIHVRTYEKGVEDETYACGTGIVASCICAWLHGIPASQSVDGRVMYNVRALRDSLSVEFVPHGNMDASFSAYDVWLTGPAAFVAEIHI